MTQSNPIIGTGKSGFEYRAEDNDGKKALLNHHKGSSAPSYAEAGVLWIDDSSTPWLLKMHDGVDWITLMAVDASTNASAPYLGTGALKLLNYAVDTGSANAYAVTPTPSVSAYIAGHMAILKPSNANTGSATLAVNGLSAKVIKLSDGNVPYAGAMLSGGIYILVYDGTNFILLNPTPQPAVLWVSDKQNSGATPSSAVTAAWTKRALNTVDKNTIAGTAHSTGAITLPAGTYSVSAMMTVANAHVSNRPAVVCRLRDTTNNMTLVSGFSQTLGLSGETAVLPCAGIFTLAGGATIELQYFCAATGTPQLGCDAGSGDAQIWAQVYMKKEA